MISNIFVILIILLSFSISVGCINNPSPDPAPDNSSEYEIVDTGQSECFNDKAETIGSCYSYLLLCPLCEG